MRALLIRTKDYYMFLPVNQHKAARHARNQDNRLRFAAIRKVSTAGAVPFGQVFKR